MRSTLAETRHCTEIQIIFIRQTVSLREINNTISIDFQDYVLWSLTQRKLFNKCITTVSWGPSGIGTEIRSKFDGMIQDKVRLGLDVSFPTEMTLRAMQLHPFLELWKKNRILPRKKIL